MPSKQVRASTIAVALLRGAIRGSGLSHEEFAAKAGISHRTLTQARRGWQLTPRMTRRIEAAFGFAIWTSDAEFPRQQAIAAWLGFDPFLCHFTVTMRRAREKGVFIRGRNPSKALVFARIFAAFAAAHPAVAPRRKRAASMISTAGTPPTEKTTNPQ